MARRQIPGETRDFRDQRPGPAAFSPGASRSFPVRSPAQRAARPALPRGTCGCSGVAGALRGAGDNRGAAGRLPTRASRPGACSGHRTLGAKDARRIQAPLSLGLLPLKQRDRRARDSGRGSPGWDMGSRREKLRAPGLPGGTQHGAPGPSSATDSLGGPEQPVPQSGRRCPALTPAAPLLSAAGGGDWEASLPPPCRAQRAGNADRKHLRLPLSGGRRFQRRS